MRRWLTALAGTALIAMLAVPSATLAAPAVTRDKPQSSLTAAESACLISVAGYQLAYICGTHAIDLRYPSGSVSRRFFVIGTDHAVWNIAEYRAGGATGWRTLGGWVQTGVYTRYWYPSNSSRLGIEAWGPSSHLWCRDLNYSWGPWYQCS
ncbi:MAG: hypothetical protein QOD24_2711 [Solirubrobacteraceae bacterium]|jgi:hypothetical protein|nr:hypothetical protein [Solirubrobacteraceae bacterium]